MLAVYLAGAIRQSEREFEYDKGWRAYAAARITEALAGEDVRVISPLAFKQFDGGRWTIFNGFEMEDQAVLQQDLQSITRSDIVLMNLLPFENAEQRWGFGNTSEQWFAGGHPNIGTFSEFGIALVQRKPVVVIASDPYLVGHPFIRAGAARIVKTVDEGIDYTIGLISVLLSKPEAVVAR